MGAPLLRIKIDVKKFLKEHFFKAKSGAIYVDVALWENRDGKDQYENDGFLTQEISKEARERGEKGPIVGNWKYLQKKQTAQEQPPPLNPPKPPPKPPADPDLDVQPDDGIPF